MTPPIRTEPLTPRRPLPDLAELARLDAAFETSPASRAIAWAAETFGDRIVLASSFQDAVMLDLVARTVPSLPVVFLDTGYHFAETLWYVERLRERYELDIEFVRPEAGRVFALEDRCAHRQVKLSAGVVAGCTVRCGYHGWHDWYLAANLGTDDARHEPKSTDTLRH